MKMVIEIPTTVVKDGNDDIVKIGDTPVYRITHDGDTGKAKSLAIAIPLDNMPTYISNVSDRIKVENEVL